MIKKLLLLNQKPKKNLVIHLIFISLLIAFLIITYNYNTYDVYQTTGIMKCENNDCYITITMIYDKIDILNQNPKIEYLNKIYDIKSITYEEPYLNNNIAYQDLNITTNLQVNNQIINFNILYNKQRIITKIKEIL